MATNKMATKVMFQPRVLDNPWNDLASEIVRQAITDYIDIKTGLYVYTGEYDESEIERFFLGKYFTGICDYDGKAILDLCKQRVEELNIRYDVKFHEKDGKYYWVYNIQTEEYIEGFIDRTDALRKAAKLQGETYSTYIRMKKKGKGLKRKW